MEPRQIKEELYQYIETGDQKLLKMLHAVAKEYATDDVEVSEMQLHELDRRLEKYANGEMNFSSWDDVKERVRTRFKNG